MKTKNILKCLVAVIAVFTYSCGSDSDGDGGTTPPGGDGSGITAITVTASDNSIELGGSVTFTVTANDGSDVTATSTISVNNSSIAGVSFTPTATGTFSIKATYEGLTSANITLTVIPPVITALRVESNDASVKIGDTAEFIVIGTDDSGNDFTITDSATISVNGTEIAGNKFMATTLNDLEATAAIEGVASGVFTLPVTDETAPATFAQNVAIEDMTGTWCGYCPRVSYAIELVEAQTDRAFIVAAHIGDAMENQYSAALDNEYNSVGYPFAIVNRDVAWASPQPNNVAQITNLGSGTTSNGLSVNSSLKGNQLEVYVSAAFSQNASGAKLVALVLEDGIIATQSNYTSYYGGNATIPGFEHNHTLRHSMTNVFGDPIPASNTMANTKYTQVFDIPVPATVSDSSKMSIVVMIVDANNRVLNVNGAKVGADADFQAN